MIRFKKIPKLLQAALCSFVLASSAGYGLAQGVNDHVINQFDSDVAAWAMNYGSATNATLVWDGTENRGPGAGTGAMKVTIDFNLCTANIQRDFESGLLASALDLTTYSKIHFSVKVDPTSSRLSDWGGGAFGNMRLHIRKSDWGGDVNIGADNATSQQWVGADAYGAWKDYALDIDHTVNLTTKVATQILGVDIWSGWGSCAAPIGHTNTVTFWVDNIWLEKITNAAPPPPPTMGLKKAGKPGLQVTMDGADQWQRDALVTPITTNCFWAGNGATPVTYSFNIVDFPSATEHPDFEAHMFIVNGSTTSAGDQTYGGCDWNAPDLVRMQITAQTNGSIITHFSWKTNKPNANPFDDATHNPAYLTNSTAIGTWSLTFTHDTNVTMSGPGGISTNFTIPIEAVQNNFSPANSFIQFGFHKNDNENNGHNNGVHGTFSRVRKTGGEAEFDETFAGPTLTNVYAWRRTSASSVQFLPPDTAWDLNWTSPATGFTPQVSPGISGPWSDLVTISTYQSGPINHALISSNAVAAGNMTLFRLIKRPFTKLQVLLPGETAAPGTVSGKTGSPSPQTAGVPFSVTVNACDAVWNVVNSSDTVAITSNETGAGLPADAPLSLGTGTFFVTLNNAGSWTITASDVTDNTKTPGTSSAVSVP